jgi:futalosine hydrolase
MDGETVLIVAAAPQELDTLPGEVVGVGPVVAAANAARIIEATNPDAVIMIGTAGAYPGGPPIGSAIIAKKLGLSYGVATMGLGYVPRAPQPIEVDPSVYEGLSVATHNVLTVSAVTTNEQLAGRLSDGWEVEHLEAYSVAFACQQRNIPCLVVLGIANEVGPLAHSEWLSNRDAAQEIARQTILPILERGRLGS